MKLIIAGTRTYTNYRELKEAVDEFILECKEDCIQIISGCARGADTLGERYAEEKHIEIIKMPADWDIFGKSAGYRRNESMAKVATHCICFWDGKSVGTKHMIDLCKKYKLNNKVFFI